MRLGASPINIQGHIFPIPSDTRTVSHQVKSSNFELLLAVMPECCNCTSEAIKGSNNFRHGLQMRLCGYLSN